jgi:predicted unusual protein kinase regulating ubiquinone biosynthesis (AarF/ABC1/UbiB family)
MSSTTVHEVLARELGAGWRQQFQRFDDDPAAAASIGQVHRARWHDGTEVAVKVQYPGAGEALTSDLKQIGRLAKVVGVMVPGLEIGPLAAELRARVAEELDYALEADAQRRFADAFRDDPFICVPDVVANTDKVLVSQWLESDRSLARLIADGEQHERDGYGERYVRFLFSGPARVGLLHADPHPGNYRILDDGRLGVVDYGAVARLPNGALPSVIGKLMAHAVRDEYDAVLEGLRDAGFVRRGVEVDVNELRTYLSPFVEPAAHDVFAFSREWMRGQFARINDPREQTFSTMLKINLPPEFLLIHRVWLGGIGVLSQLGASAPFASILADSLPGFAEVLAGGEG